MLSVEEARALMLPAMVRLPDERVALSAALGRTLAAPVLAQRDHPPYAASAMDGYAVRSADTPGQLAVIGESAAGRGFSGVCGIGQAVRISTGAALPEGADSIVIQEDVQRDGERIDVPRTRPDRHIRIRALDFAAGRELLPAGQRLDGVALALAAASGLAFLPVVRSPRIALLGGGDELVAPGTEPGPYQIFDSGSYGLAGLIADWGGRTQRLALEADNADSIARTALQGFESSDLLVVIGGASVGDHDHARAALSRLGLELACYKIAVRPGKPTWFGATPMGPVLGLPGNPASALVCAHLFLRPLMEAMLGRDPLHCVQPCHARLEMALPPNGDREHYLRARAAISGDGQLIVRAHENQDSSMLSVFAAANALIRLAPNQQARAAGALVDVLLLEKP